MPSHCPHGSQGQRSQGLFSAPRPLGCCPVTSLFRFTLEIPGPRIKQMIFLFHLDLSCAFVCPILGNPAIGRSGQEHPSLRKGVQPGTVGWGKEGDVGGPPLPALWPQPTVAPPVQHPQRVPRLLWDQWSRACSLGLRRGVHRPPLSASREPLCLVVPVLRLLSAGPLARPSLRGLQAPASGSAAGCPGVGVAVFVWIAWWLCACVAVLCVFN